jgi:hypothetical protein
LRSEDKHSLEKKRGKGDSPEAIPLGIRPFLTKRKSHGERLKKASPSPGNKNVNKKNKINKVNKINFYQYRLIIYQYNLLFLVFLKKDRKRGQPSNHQKSLRI